MSAGDEPAPIGNRRLFWITALIGWALIVTGIRGVIVDARFTRPPQWTAWFIGAAVFHDFGVAPFVFAVAAGPLRGLHRPYRAIIQAALVLTALITAMTLPVLLRLGRTGGNPTVLPTSAARPFAIVVGAIWVVTAAALAAAGRFGHRDPRRMDAERPSSGLTGSSR